MKIIAMLRELRRGKEVEIIEEEASRDHIHMLISVAPKLSIASLIKYLKEKAKNNRNLHTKSIIN